MPIRINLLAEAQAAEELRRKDPVKRAIIMGAGFMVLMAIASAFLQLQVMRTKSEAKSYAERIQSITNEYAVVMGNSEQFQKINLQQRGLEILASERFLYGTLLNSIQKVYVDDVQLVHIRSEQSYVVTAEVVDKKTKRVTKPGLAAEHITLVIEARDVSSNPGDQVNQFKEAFAQNAYFQTLLGADNDMRLANYSPPQLAGDLGRTVVQFTLEAKVPEKVRLGISSPQRYAAPRAASASKVNSAPRGPVKL